MQVGKELHTVSAGDVRRIQWQQADSSVTGVLIGAGIAGWIGTLILLRTVKNTKLSEDTALGVILKRWRTWDFIAAQRVDRYVANSETTRRRIGRYFDRDKSLDSTKEIFKFAKTVLFTAGNPVNEVQFRVSPAADQYSLATMAYLFLTGALETRIQGRTVLFDVTPIQLAYIAADELPSRYVRRLAKIADIEREFAPGA